MSEEEKEHPQYCTPLLTKEVCEQRTVAAAIEYGKLFWLHERADSSVRRERELELRNAGQHLLMVARSYALLLEPESEPND